MLTFPERVGVGARSFGRNSHLDTPKLRTVLSEVTGLPCGRIVEHGDGRQDAHAKAERTITVSAEQIHGSFREGRAWLYHQLRESGFSHEQAMRRMTREGI